MMPKTAFVLLLLGICLTQALSSEKPRKFKKAQETHKKKFLSIQEKLERLQEEEAELEEELEEELDLEELNEKVRKNNASSAVPEVYEFGANPEEQQEMRDPCRDIYCGAGRECIITAEGKGVCQCVEKCSDAQDDRRKVCSNYNDTWASDCELYKMRCHCSENSNLCANTKFEHMHIDYYGNCQKIPDCQEEEMSDFPRRMREWLFNIMRDMADREELNDRYMKMEKVAENDNGKKWSIAAVWKWCELDGHPKDRAVSRHELFPLRAPLYTLEHCIAPFLNSCDPDDDHYVTLQEWIKCLQLSEEEIEDMEDFCVDITDQ